MGIVKGLERGLERLVAKAFRGAANDGVKPVEIANRLRNVMDDEAFALSEGRTVAPHSFTVRLGDEDYEKARGWGQPLAQELADVALEHAQAQDYTLRDAVSVTFRHDPSLGRGHLEVDSSLGGPQAAPPRPSRPAPAAAPAPAPEIPRGATTRIAPPPPRPQAPTPVIEVEGRRYGINAEEITIGRSSEADIQVDDTGVSRKHTAIVRRGDQVYARDLGSTNGTFVNGTRITGDTELLDGTVVALGHTRITFRLEANPQGVK
ncbi:FhaA domain-containing protein [Galactobacter valiniphilus]|uniref:FhaA domain-containing protein n=1 Tax=Galactobacter valiniphilus TaxID=2676122 RepID=UPI003736826F